LSLEDPLSYEEARFVVAHNRLAWLTGFARLRVSFGAGLGKCVAGHADADQNAEADLYGYFDTYTVATAHQHAFADGYGGAYSAAPQRDSHACGHGAAD
jgi:hypothetical protein